MEYKSQEYVQQLQWKLDTLKSEIQKTQAEIEEKSAVVGEKQQQVEHVLKLLDAEGVKIDRTELDGIIPVSLSEVAAKILRDSGEPMHYKKIAAAIQGTGRRIAGQNPPATIIALLHRKKDEFVRLDSGVWGLKEWGKTPQPKKANRKKARRGRRKS